VGPILLATLNRKILTYHFWRVNKVTLTVAVLGHYVIKFATRLINF